MLLDTSGFSVLTPSTDSRVIYVSSSTGDDANDGLSEASPKKTIVAAKLRLRDGFPDWICLKKGDVWINETLYLNDAYQGRSPDERMVITSYGTGPRPIMDGGKIFCRESAHPLRYVSVVGIEFRNDSGPLTQSAIQWLIPAAGAEISDVHVEDCVFRGHNVGLQMAGAIGATIDGVVVRRNIFDGCIGMGMLISYASNVTITENVFNRNGWENRSVFLQGVYVRECTQLLVESNVFAYSGNSGLKISADRVESCADFVVRGNVFYRNMLALDHSAGPYGDPVQTVTHTRGLIENNVISEPGKDFPSAGTSQNIGTYLLNIGEVTFAQNYFVHNTTDGPGQTLNFSLSFLKRNLILTDNVVWNWRSFRHDQSGSYMSGHDVNAVNITQTNNLREDVTYADATRSVGTFAATVGYASVDEWLNAACGRIEKEWMANLTAAACVDHVAAGFVVSGTLPDPVPDPGPVPDPDPVPDPVPDPSDKIVSAIDRLTDAFRQAFRIEV